MLSEKNFFIGSSSTLSKSTYDLIELKSSNSKQKQALIQVLNRSPFLFGIAPSYSLVFKLFKPKGLELDCAQVSILVVQKSLLVHSFSE